MDPAAAEAWQNRCLAAIGKLERPSATAHRASSTSDLENVAYPREGRFLLGRMHRTSRRCHRDTDISWSASCSCCMATVWRVSSDRSGRPVAQHRSGPGDSHSLCSACEHGHWSSAGSVAPPLQSCHCCCCCCCLCRPMRIRSSSSSPRNETWMYSLEFARESSCGQERLRDPCFACLHASLSRQCESPRPNNRPGSSNKPRSRCDLALSRSSSVGIEIRGKPYHHHRHAIHRRLQDVARCYLLSRVDLLP